MEWSLSWVLWGLGIALLLGFALLALGGWLVNSGDAARQQRGQHDTLTYREVIGGWLQAIGDSLRQSFWWPW